METMLKTDTSPSPTNSADADDKLPLCIWHGGCLDGFTSAWVVNAFFDSKIEFCPGVYQETPPDVADRNVLMVDFSYKKPVIEEMRKTARSILILDHHKTAEADLSAYHPRADIVRGFPHFPKPGEVCAFFDMNRSGAALCWDFFFPGQPQPRFVQHVQDRDLWRFNLAGTREINTLAYSQDFTFEIFDDLIEKCETLHGFEEMVAIGAALERMRTKDCLALVAHGKTMMEVGGVFMPVVNAPWFYASEIGNHLAENDPGKCGATYYNRGDGKRTWSLRSVDGGPDVSEIAKAMGGGGHEHSAGFTTIGGSDAQDRTDQ